VGACVRFRRGLPRLFFEKFRSGPGSRQISATLTFGRKPAQCPSASGQRQTCWRRRDDVAKNDHRGVIVSSTSKLETLPHHPASVNLGEQKDRYSYMHIVRNAFLSLDSCHRRSIEWPP
jgi:hypothetical protein